MNCPDKVTVIKVNKAFDLYDFYTIDIKKLGGKWCQFLMKTGFCRIPYYTQVYNDTAKTDMYGSFYIVESNYRRMMYNENNDADDKKFIYVREFVEFVLNKYKYNLYQ